MTNHFFFVVRITIITIRIIKLLYSRFYLQESRNPLSAPFYVSSI